MPEKNKFAEVAHRPEPLHVLMCTPTFFDIIDEKNIHMQGFAGTVNKSKSEKQWKAIYSIYEQEAELGNIDGVCTIEGVSGCEDMVFAANQSFPWLKEDGTKMVVLSRMRYPSRQEEVIHFKNYYEGIDYSVMPPPGDGLLEGMGDLIPVPGKQIIFGGYGHRTDLTTLHLMEELLNCTIIPLELVSESFYHLDTCFIPVNTHTALIVESAFNADGINKINDYFEQVHYIPEAEASKGFALNAHLVNGHQYPFAIIQSGNPVTKGILEKENIKVYEVDTSEYIKSGGSVFCMKMMHY